MRYAILVGTVLIAACGRFGFDQQVADPIPDPDPLVDAAPVGPPNGFICNEPQRFPSSGVPIAAITATPTSNGHAIFMVDTAGNLAAWTYEIAGNALTPTAANIAIDTDITSTLSATSVGSSIMVGAVNGLVTPIPLGSKLYPLDELGAARGSAITYSEFAADQALASGLDGKLAFANIDATTKELMVREIDSFGVFNAVSPAIVAPAADAATYATLGQAGPGFVAQWNVSTALQDPLMVALIDETFAVVAGPVQANTNGTGEGPGRPRVVWAKTSNTYLVTWDEKNGTDDDVWFQIRDSNLGAVTLPAILGPSGVRAEVSTDGTVFWVSWKSFQTGTLAAARIGPTGVVTSRPVTTSGGSPSRWTMLANKDQPILVWVETGGSGPDLWIDPLCP